MKKNLNKFFYEHRTIGQDHANYVPNAAKKWLINLFIESKTTNLCVLGRMMFRILTKCFANSTISNKKKNELC